MRHLAAARLTPVAAFARPAAQLLPRIAGMLVTLAVAATAIGAGNGPSSALEIHPYSAAAQEYVLSRGRPVFVFADAPGWKLCSGGIARRMVDAPEVSAALASRAAVRLDLDITNRPMPDGFPATIPAYGLLTPDGEDTWIIGQLTNPGPLVHLIEDRPGATAAP